MKLRQGCHRGNDTVTGRMSHTESPAPAAFTSTQRGCIRRELDRLFSTLPILVDRQIVKLVRVIQDLTGDVRVRRRQCLAEVGNRLSLAVGEPAGDLGRENRTAPSMVERRFSVSKAGVRILELAQQFEVLRPAAIVQRSVGQSPGRAMSLQRLTSTPVMDDAPHRLDARRFQTRAACIRRDSEGMKEDLPQWFQAIEIAPHFGQRSLWQARQ